MVWVAGFWLDRWLEHEPLLDKSDTHLPRTKLRKPLADYWDQTQLTWKLEMLSQWWPTDVLKCPMQEQVSVMGIKKTNSSVNLQLPETQGKCIASWIRKLNTPKVWKQLRKFKAPHCVSLLLWFTAPIGYQLEFCSQKDISVTLDYGSVCPREEETVMHIL